ncbi:MAG: sel1 repeat family protein [Aeriscardovia sp.]|nr:sel1 repeat family protein [Aeriscardovia sp.]
MAKKIRFPLQMKVADVRTIEELREHFDLESILGYYANGKLVMWLRNRYYDKEANDVEALSATDEKIASKLCDILKITHTEEKVEIDIDIIKKKQEELTFLRQIIDGEKITVDNIEYFLDDLVEVLEKDSESFYLLLSKYFFNNGEVENGFMYLSKSNMDNQALYALGRQYQVGNGVVRNLSVSFKIYQLMSEKGYADAQYMLGWCYHTGTGTKYDMPEALKWYRLSAKNGNMDAKCKLQTLMEDFE